jgi:hypothetical protein
VTVFEDNIVTNTKAPQMIDAITLHHTGNLQGNFFSISLQSGKTIYCAQYTHLPLIQRVKDAVSTMGKRQKQPLLQFLHFSIGTTSGQIGCTGMTTIMEWKQENSFFNFYNRILMVNASIQLGCQHQCMVI